MMLGRCVRSGALAVVLACAVVGLTTTPAAAAGTSAIAGTVSFAGGPPTIVDVWVYSDAYGTLLKTTATDFQGRYRVSGLPAGKVKVRFSGNEYPDQWAGGAPSRKSTTPITLSTGNTVTLHHVMRKPGTLAGVVASTNGTPLPGMAVLVTPANQPEVFASSTTDARGVFSFTVPSFDYKVLVYDAVPTDPDYLVQLNGGVILNGASELFAGLAAAPPIPVAELTPSYRWFLLTTDNCTPATYRPGADLSGASLAGVNVSGCNLEGADLSGAAASSADFRGARLVGADFSGAQIDGALWTGALCPDGSTADSHGATCVGHLGGAGGSTTSIVDSTTDAPDASPGDGVCQSTAGGCTLRAAVQEANAGPNDTIQLAPVTYLMTIPGRGEDAAATGDLDLTGPTTIHGNGANVDAGQLDRVLHVRPGANVAIDGLTVTGGKTTDGTTGSTGVTPSGAGGQGNPGEDGGGILNAGTLSLTTSSVTGNTTGRGGTGGVGGNEMNVGGGFDGTGMPAGPGGNGGTGGRGGGIANSGSLTIQRSTVSGNTTGAGGTGGRGGEPEFFMPEGWYSSGGDGGTGGTAGHGAGVFSNGALSITNVTIGGNSSGFGGDAGQGGQVPVWWVTLCEPGFSCWGAQPGSAGAAGKSGAGGGLFVAAGAATITAATISANVVHAGGTAPGLAVLFGNATLRSTIVGSPTAATDCAGPINSAGYNVESSASCKFTAAGDQQNTIAGLGALLRNGGPTSTFAPNIGSPLLNAVPVGTNGCGTTLTTDQRGLPRPVGGACDIGAVER